MRIRRIASILALFLGFSALALRAHADGKVFATVDIATIPDQRVLIHYAEGVETLVVQTAFSGSGTNFAWVVPVPTKPEVFAVKPWFFDNLNRVFQPWIMDRFDSIPWGLFTVLPLLCLFCANLLARDRLSTTQIFLVVAIIGLLAAISIPNFVVPRGPTTASVAEDGVQIHDRKDVGVFATTTISSDDDDALSAWLTAEGFHVSEEDRPAIRDYVADGWFFVASKVRRDAANHGSAELHPLAFKFETQEPVYPLKLTGVSNATCDVELYVFGEDMAVIEGFETTHCGRPEYPKPPKSDAPFSDPTPQPGKPRIRNPELRAIVGNAPVATKLTASLTHAQMTEDAHLRWTAAEMTAPKYYTQSAARYEATNRAGAALSVYLIALIALRAKKPDAKRLLAISTAIAFALAFGVYSFDLSRKEVVTVKYEPDTAKAFIWNAHMIQGAFQQMALDARNQAEPKLPIYTNQTASAFHDSITPHYLKILPDVRFITSDDEIAPQTLRLIESDLGLELIAYDSDGIRWSLATMESLK